MYYIRNWIQSTPIKRDFIAEWNQWNYQLHINTIYRWRNFGFEHNFVVKLKYWKYTQTAEQFCNNTYFSFPIRKIPIIKLSQIQALFLTLSLFAAICSWIKKGWTTIIVTTFQIPLTLRVHVTVTLSITTRLFFTAAFFKNKVLFFSIDQPGWKISGIAVRVTRSYHCYNKCKFKRIMMLGIRLRNTI